MRRPRVGASDGLVSSSGALLLLLTWAGLDWAGAREILCSCRERMGGGRTYDELDALLLGELAGARIGSN